MLSSFSSSLKHRSAVFLKIFHSLYATLNGEMHVVSNSKCTPGHDLPGPLGRGLHVAVGAGLVAVESNVELEGVWRAAVKGEGAGVWRIKCPIY